MMITRLIFLSLFTVLFSFGAIAQKDVSSKSLEKIKELKQTNPEIGDIFGSAYGYALFPSIGKGGIGIGGAMGNGTVFKGGTAVGDCKMTQLSIGFQFGGQKYAEVIFFENEKAYNRFIEGNLEFAAQASAVALKSGVSIDAKYRDGIMVFTHISGGLMYEASVGGQKFKVKMY